MFVTPRLNKVIFALYLLITIAVFIATLVSPTVRALAYAPLRDLLLPFARIVFGG